MPKSGSGRPRGRPPKPVEQHRLAGNPSNKVLPLAPLAGQGLPAADGVPDGPTFMDHGQELWRRVWTAGHSWLSVGSDFDVVVLLCHAADEAEELRLGLVRGDFPRFYSLPNGSEVTHPAVSQLKDLRQQMTSWLAALGFSPADRARLGVGEVRRADFLDELNAMDEVGLRRRERAAGA